MLENQPLNPVQGGNQRNICWKIFKVMLILSVPLISACLFCLFTFKVLVNNPKSSRQQEIETISPMFKEFMARELTDISTIDLFFATVGNSFSSSCKFIILTPSYDSATLNIRSLGTQLAVYQDFINTLQVFKHAIGIVYLNIDGALQPIIILWLAEDAPLEVKEAYRTKYSPLVLSKIPFGLSTLEAHKIEDIQLEKVLQSFLHSTFNNNILPGAWIYNQQGPLNILDSTAYPSSVSEISEMVFPMFIDQNTKGKDQLATQDQYDPTRVNQEGIKTVTQDILFFLKTLSTKILIIEPGDNGFRTPIMTLENSSRGGFQRLLYLLSISKTNTLIGYNFEYEGRLQPIIILWRPSTFESTSILTKEIYMFMMEFQVEDLPIFIAYDESSLNRYSLLQVAIKDFSVRALSDKQYAVYNRHILKYLKSVWCII